MRDVAFDEGTGAVVQPRPGLVYYETIITHQTGKSGTDATLSDESNRSLPICQVHPYFQALHR